MTGPSRGGADSRSMWTPANVVTLLRICLVPVFVVALLSPWPEWFGVLDVVPDSLKAAIAAGVFVFISCTDWIDGYLARSRGEVTDLGKLLDPLADKILVAAALIALVELQVIPSWPVLVILTREFIVSGIRMLAATKGFVIAASWYGKAKTVAQIVAIVMFLVKDFLKEAYINPDFEAVFYVCSWAVMAIALILTVVSMLDYISKAKPLLFGTAGSNSSKGVASQADDSEFCKEEVAGIGEEAAEFVRLCRERSLHACTAESLTGGMISAAITSVPGSSEVLRGAFVTYACDSKRELLGVDGILLEEDGPVNEETARQMAVGAASRLSCDVCISATGIAGPGGAEPGKPVGTVFIGVFINGAARVFHCEFDGGREDVRRQTVEFALSQALEALRGMPAS